MSSPQHDKLEANLARLASRVPEHGLASLAPHEQAALIAYSAHGTVAHGGFKEFYAGPVMLSQLVAALRELKLNALATAAQATTALFPDPALVDDVAARRDHLAEFDSARQDYVFFRLSTEELLDAIAKYWKRVKA